MVVLAISPTERPGLVVSSGSSTDWVDCPTDITKTIQQCQSRDEILLDVSFGRTGEWFLRTDKYNYYHKKFNIAGVSPTGVSAIGAFLRNSKDRKLQSIEHFTFMPEPLGYYCIYRDSEGCGRAVWSGVPTSLRAHLEHFTSQHMQRESNSLGVFKELRPIKCAVGYKESWVAIQSNGEVDFSGVSETLAEKLRLYKQRPIKHVVLSLITLGYYFIEYEDGKTDYVLPRAWHAMVDSHELGSKITPFPTYNDVVVNNYIAQYGGSNHLGIITNGAGSRSSPDSGMGMSLSSYGSKGSPPESKRVSTAVEMDLRVHVMPPKQGTFYMPGEKVLGWVKCRSSCFQQGTPSSITTLRARLTGECCAFVTDHHGTRHFESEEIMNQLVTFYDSENPVHREAVETTRQFVKLRFTLTVAEYTSSEIGPNPSVNGKMPLPPSYKDEHAPDSQYIKYSVSAWGSRSNGEPPYIDQTEIKVMPWDLDSLKPEIKLPQPASHDLLAFRSPEHDWKVIQHWTPLKATVHERYEYFGISTPHEPVAAQPTALCNGCDEIIFGPRFICCLCMQKDFNWCWSCISDPAEQHPTNHPFVRIDSSVDEDDYRQRNEVARALVATNSVSSVSSGTNFVHEITSEVIHEIKIPKRAHYSYGMNFPMIMTIKCRAVSMDELKGILPSLPWNACSEALGETQGPSTCLEVGVNAYVEGIEKSSALQEYHWHMPTAIAPDDLSQDWTEPRQAESGLWEQSAIIYQTIAKTTSVERHWIEPQINLSILRSHFNLHIKHVVAGRMVDILLSEVPWTSGIYQDYHRLLSLAQDRVREHLTIPRPIHNLSISQFSLSSAQESPPAYSATL